MTTVTERKREVAYGPRAATHAALDVMLTEAAVEPGMAGRLVRPGAAVRLPGSLARRPQRVTRRVAGFAGELARVAAGASQLTPPKGDPQVLKETIDRGGANLGRNLAASEGSVVMHTEVFELIQYRPTTTEVYETPLLIVPPTINKYYIVDLAPGRSMVEYLVGQGHQVFVVSWRNPDREHAFFDFDTYAQSVLEARDAAAEIARKDTVNVMAACSGGIISSGALGHLADEGKLGGLGSLTLRGSWWSDYVAWLEPRAGKLVFAPKRLGSRTHKAMAKAPGTYVMVS